MTPVETLVALGFADLEARVYCALLRASPATGYGVAKALGRATANVYQALGSLVQKGAVELADAQARSYRAVPYEDLLSAMDRGFQDRRRAATSALSAFAHEPGGETVRQLKTVEQALDRAHRMIEAATSIVLFDLFPLPFTELRGALEAAEARGVLTAGMVYEPEAARARWLYMSRVAPIAAERWPGQGLILVADASEHIVSLLSQDGRRLLHGVWSDSRYLSCIHHSGIGAEIRLTAAQAQTPAPLAEVSLFGAAPPGLQSLLRPVVHAREAD